MTNSHIYSYYVQFAVLIALVVLQYVSDSFAMVLYLFAMFLICEISILEASRRMKPEEIRYRKSCLFALFDMIAVTAYFAYIVLFAFALVRESKSYVWDFHFFKIPVEISSFWFSLWAVYTLARKIYIYKNLTYEK